MQKVMAIGNLGRDPETRYTQGGQAVTNFSIAVTERYKKDGQNVEKTEWINCVAFARLAEVCGEYLKKGSKVYIEGKLSTSKYEKENQTHYKTDVVLREMQMLDSKSSEKPDRSTAMPESDTGFEDDIPFR